MNVTLSRVQKSKKRLSPVSDLERNRANVVAFYDMMFNKNEPRQAVERYAGDDYIQHNPHVASGTAGLIDYFEKMARDYPAKSVTFKRVIAEGDFVVLHCHQVWPGAKDYAGIDIFRLDPQGRVVEHWDVLQEMPAMRANANGMF